jgi:hypothetical protein
VLILYWIFIKSNLNTWPLLLSGELKLYNPSNKTTRDPKSSSTHIKTRLRKYITKRLTVLILYCIVIISSLNTWPLLLSGESNYKIRQTKLHEIRRAWVRILQRDFVSTLPKAFLCHSMTEVCSYPKVWTFLLSGAPINEPGPSSSTRWSSVELNTRYVEILLQGPKSSNYEILQWTTHDPKSSNHEILYCSKKQRPQTMTYIKLNTKNMYNTV